MRCLLVLAMSAGALVFGCGGKSAQVPSECGRSSPCGGDLTGTWKVIGACVNTSAIAADVRASCAQETITINTVDGSGSITFGSDMTYANANIVEHNSLSSTEPASCLSGRTCAEQAASLQTPVATASCTGTSSCTCSVNSTTDYFGSSGSYTISGVGLLGIASNGGGNLDSISYCVDGDVLHLLTLLPATSDGGSSSTVAVDIVAQRQ